MALKSIQKVKVTVFKKKPAYYEADKKFRELVLALDLEQKADRKEFRSKIKPGDQMFKVLESRQKRFDGNKMIL